MTVRPWPNTVRQHYASAGGCRPEADLHLTTNASCDGLEADFAESIAQLIKRATE